MPVITIVCNKVASADAKRGLLTSVSELVAGICHVRMSLRHVHAWAFERRAWHHQRAAAWSHLGALKLYPFAVNVPLQIPTGHVHLYVQDGAFYAFGGDVDTAAAYVTVKSSALQILPEGRKEIVRELMPILSTAFPGLSAERVNSFFEELPVENIAVGTNIATFATSPTGVTGRASIGAAPLRV